jgi:hypothetical protein
MKAAAIFLRLLVFFPLGLNRWRMFVSLRRACNARSQRNIPGAKVITESDLDADDRQFFQKDHHGACPGLIKVDFYGDGKHIFGLELITGSQAGPNIKLVIARQIGLNWNLLFLARTRRNAPVIWVGQAWRYQGIWGDKLHAAHCVIVWQGYESWAVLYAWNGRKVEHIQLVD